MPPRRQSAPSFANLTRWTKWIEPDAVFQHQHPILIIAPTRPVRSGVPASASPPLGHQDRVASLDGGERAAGGCAPRRRSGPASERARRRCARDPIPGADAVPDTRYRTDPVPDTRYPHPILCPIPDTLSRSCARYPISAPSGELGLTFDRGYPQNRPSIRYQQSSCRTRISYVGVLTNGCRSPITVRYGQQQ